MHLILGLGVVTAAHSAQLPAPESIFGFYAERHQYCYDQPTATDPHARKCIGDIVSRAVIVPHTSDQVFGNVLLFGATDHSCEFSGHGEWQGDHLVLRKVVEPRICELRIEFRDGRLWLLDMDAQCQPNFCTSRAGFGGRSLRKRGSI